MKLRNIIISLGIMFLTNPLNAGSKKIVQDNEGKFIEAEFNTAGIITRLTGIVSDYYPDDGLSVKHDGNIIKIHKSMSGDSCFDIELIKYEKYLSLTKIFTSNSKNPSKDNLTYKIFFDRNNEYLVKDDFVKIRKDTKISEIPESRTDSYLPMFKYEKNICTQFFGKKIDADDIGSRKYVYSVDNKTVECYQIMPGDTWGKYMTATVFDFKTSDTAVNLINYIILYNYDNQLGVMFFPILFDMDEMTSKYQEIEISADSYLTEGSIKYLPENLNKTDRGTPWVEGQPGDGIGSKIIVKAKESVSSLIISNGFDSGKKSTYENNNRVKQIKITNMENKKKYHVSELPDSASPYEINLPFSAKYLEIEILSVYKGSKYEDTCLNYILAK